LAPFDRFNLRAAPDTTGQHRDQIEKRRHDQRNAITNTF
jgi:hypothetical protein